jgi:hypothetical protein
MTTPSRRVAAAVAAAAALAAGSATAYGYWTATGAGTGTATVAADAGVLRLHAAAATPLSPGGSSDVTFTADNPAASSLRVGTLHLVGVTADTGHSGCLGADFAMADVVSHTLVPAGAAGVPLAGTGTLTMADTAQNQDACKGATLTLELSST